MVKDTKVRYAFGRTIPIAQFELVRVDVSVESTCEEEEEPSEVYNKLRRFVRKRIEEEEAEWQQ